ncbi:LacI family transcriptional regulator [Lutibacter sp. Hel_I_33_5]|uniref:LacI family DNA-binding transcriptional regulator n=1 Tax=Lutibacter sp. Hel_I_33_5 TaxID=1566289 RepID=UPI00119E75C6|nr:LacI family DNA-binding transcriptional regulator [Lutibacter sp. Hel_I_33_5]TVZ55643.1 LacI family transcriptional regulator [Lutibacter sp. Hel_I_33_5]
MKTNKVTIHDIARALGLDSSTVSRALNDSSRVTKKTKEKVQAKAKELGYQRNLIAANLRKSVTNTIGVVVPRISRYFFSSVIEGIEETAYKENYNVIICQSLEELEREKQILDTLVSNRVDGVLISISMETKDYNHMDSLKTSGTPYVLFDRYCDIPKNNSVLIDDFKGGYKATNHLISKGYKNIIHFSGPLDLEMYKNRLKGYKKALEDNNIKFNEDFVLTSKLMEKDGMNIAAQLLENKVNFDGIFSANDVAAIGAMKHLKNNGIKIPDNVGIVGFSNEPISRVIEPGLTTIDQSGNIMGKKATELLLKTIKNKDFISESQTIILDSKLIERNSSNK